MIIRLVGVFALCSFLFLSAAPAPQLHSITAGQPPPAELMDLRSPGTSPTHAKEARSDPNDDPFGELPLELVRDAPVAPAGARLPPEMAFGPYSRRVRASFRIRVRDLTIPYRVLAVTARPGERLRIELDEVWGEGTSEEFRLRSSSGIEPPERPGVWMWTAPVEPGPVALRVESPRDGDAVSLNVFVLHPFEDASDGHLNGFQVGEYRAPTGTAPPPGFVEASEEVLDLRVAPGFTLRQFLPHQPGQPRYLALSEPLLLKLEAILEEVRASGIEARTLHVMSAFRTPHYNRAIGNTTDGSRHLWGDAADVFIDESGDGWMDDLTGDGRGGEADARVLVDIIERVEARGEPHVRPGGLSLYRANSVRGPFLHVDARGVAARW